jgi:hypothetical protein
MVLLSGKERVPGCAMKDIISSVGMLIFFDDILVVNQPL